MEYFQDLQSWHWLTLSFLMFGLEALGAAGFLIGAGVGALLMAVVSYIFPDMGWQGQLMGFAISSIVFSVLYLKLFRRFNDTTDAPDINKRAEQLLGRRMMLEENLPTGQGKIQIGDTLWKVESPSPLQAGVLVEVLGADEMTLKIQAVES